MIYGDLKQQQKRSACRRIAALLLCALLLTGCAKEPASEEITQLSQLEGKTAGLLNSVWPGDAAMFAGDYGVDALSYNSYDGMSDAFYALATQEIDCLLVPGFVASYLTLRDAALGMVPSSNTQPREVCMVLDHERSALRDELDTALLALREDGTLDALHEEWITNLYPFTVLEGEALPTIAGAPTYRVGLSGELEPLDYISLDNLAGGYSANLLLALSTRMGVNFEPVYTPPKSGFAPLLNGEVDLLFAVVDADPLQQALSSFYPAATVPHFRFDSQAFLVARDYTRLRGCTDMSRSATKESGSSFQEFQNK